MRMEAPSEPKRLLVDPRGRSFYWLRTPSLAIWPSALALDSPNFGCLVIADGTAETTEQVGRWADIAVAQGLVFSDAWGRGSDVVEDCVDWAFVALPDCDTRPVIMTSSPGDDESLESASWFFVWVAFPHPVYQDQCRSLIVVEVGDAGGKADIPGLISWAVTHPTSD